MRKVLSAILAFALLALPAAILPVAAASAADSMISDLLPDEYESDWLITTSDCDVWFNYDGSMTVEITGSYPSLWVDMAIDGEILIGDPVNVKQPAYFALDFYTEGSIVVRDLIFHYTRKDKAALGTEADLYMASMYNTDYAQYRKQSDGMLYDPMVAIPDGSNRYVVWDWGAYLRSDSKKLFDDGKHHFTSMELDLTGSAIGSEITFFTIGVVSDPDVELGQHAIGSEEEFVYEVADGGAVLTMYNGYDTAVVIPEELDGYPVTAIGPSAFAGNIFLESVQIPETVTAIGDYAFSMCIGLTGIDLPKGLTTVGEGAFMLCSLETIDLPASLTEIGINAFLGCSDCLQSITVEAGNPVYEAQGNCLIEKAEKTLLLGCASSVIPEGIAVIGESAFLGCSGLTDVKLPDGVERLMTGAFAGCMELVSISLPEGLQEIGDSAFSDCGSLTDVKLSKGLKRIGYAAFVNCIALTSIELPDGLESIGNEAFIDSSLTSIVIPGSVKSIGDYAFYACYDLIDAKIPASVVTMGEHVFGWCEALTDVYCEAETKPAGWAADWLGEHQTANVYWGYTPEPEPSALSTGDLDGDGEIGATDYMLLKRAVLETYTLTEEQKAAADINGDGDVNATDYMLLKRAVLGTYVIG